MDDFQTFRQRQETLKKPDPIIAQAEGYAALNPGVMDLKQDSPGADAGLNQIA